MLATLAAFLVGSVGDVARPIEVRFEHCAPPATGEHSRIFAGARLVFSAAHTEIILNAGALAAPLHAADPRLGAMIREDAEAALARVIAHESFLDRLPANLAAAITRAHRVSLDDMARNLGIGPRTLQRKLRAEGRTFTQLLTEARINAAKALLADARLAIGQLSHRLGFSQPSAFHRAFRKAVGMTPRAFRERGSDSA
jgi:AraC-like DNA-binding protein